MANNRMNRPGIVKRLQSVTHSDHHTNEGLRVAERQLPVEQLTLILLIPEANKRPFLAGTA